MRWYHLSTTALLLLFSSFFWEDDEKEIKALQLMAESAMRDDDYAAAKEAYHTLLKRVDVREGKKNSVDWQTYSDMVMRFAEACAQLEACDEGIAALEKLLSKHPPEAFLPRIQLYKARLVSQASEPQKAYVEMQNVLDALPNHEWRARDLSFYHALRYTLDATYDDLLRKAKRLSATGFVDEAIQIYEQVLAAVKAGYYPKARYNEMLEKKLRYLLVEAHYQQKNYARSVALAQGDLDTQNAIDRETLYLIALCHKERAEYERALACFVDYTQEGGEHRDQALFEIGYHYYRAGNREEARRHFKLLQKPLGKKPKPTVVAATYLARMLLEEERYGEVETLLTPLLERLPPQDNLRYELWYLQGEAAFAREAYREACSYFESAVPPRGRGAWRLQALYKLGWSYLKLGMESGSSDDFAKAEGLFLRLLPTEEEEAATLALGHLYLEQKGEGMCERLHALLGEKHLSLAGEHEALLILAEGEKSYLERERRYKEACASRFVTCPTYPKGWYQRGVNHFQHGLDTPEEGEWAFEYATAAFEEAFVRYKDRDPKAAARILKLEAKADFYRNSPSTSMAYLEELLEQYSEMSDEREEALYLRGIIASSLNDETLAQSCLEQVIELYPKGRFAADALFWLGSLHYQKEAYEEGERCFLTLAQHYPDSPYAGDGWYWAALSSEKQGGEERRLKRLRKQVYERYPHSQYAPEAYFHQYPYTAYLEGEEEALAHLMPFPHLFPRSPLVVAVHYVMGKHAHSYEKGVWRFKEAIRAFHAAPSFDPSTLSFLYEARLELALLHLDHEAKRAKRVLKIVLEEFADPHHPLTSKLPDRFALFEKAQYTYAECCLKLGEVGEAQEALSLLLDRYKERGVREGLYLASAWRESGKLALQCADTNTALACFEIAYACGEQTLPVEKRLDLLLLKSACYKEQKEYDLSMRLLSKVINADIASPLRLKAMLLRADLYELQERPELAMRQLESVAKMGGEWGHEAEEKLKERYGFE